MSVVVITPPAFVLVSLEEAKTHLRVDFDDDDAYIESLVEAATVSLDGPAGWLGRALITQTLEWRGCEFPASGDICLPFPPVAGIVSVKYDDDDGVEQTVLSSDYRLVGQPGMPRLFPIVGQIAATLTVAVTGTNSAGSASATSAGAIDVIAA